MLWEASSTEYLIRLPDGAQAVRLISSEKWEVQVAEAWVPDQAVRWDNGFLI